MLEENTDVLLHVSQVVYMHYTYFFKTTFVFKETSAPKTVLNRVYVFTCSKIYHLMCLVHVLYVLKIGACNCDINNMM